MRSSYALLLLIAIFLVACQKKETSALVTPKPVKKADSVVQLQQPAFIPAIDTFLGWVTESGANITPDTLDTLAYIYVHYFALDSILFSSDQSYVWTYVPSDDNSFLGFDMEMVMDSANYYAAAYNYEGEQSYSFRFVHDSLYYGSFYNDVSTYILYDINIAAKKINKNR